MVGNVVEHSFLITNSLHSNNNNNHTDSITSFSLTLQHLYKVNAIENFDAQGGGEFKFGKWNKINSVNLT